MWREVIVLFFEIQNRGYTGKIGIHGDNIFTDQKIRNCLPPYAHIEHLRIFRTVRIHHLLFGIGEILPCSLVSRVYDGCQGTYGVVESPEVTPVEKVLTSIYIISTLIGIRDTTSNEPRKTKSIIVHVSTPIYNNYGFLETCLN